MKIKLLPILAMVSLAVVFSCKNPQKEAEQNAAQESKMADREEAKAEEQLSSGAEHAQKAAEHRTAAAMNEALKSVEVPTFDNQQATTLVNNLGSDAVAFANSENYSEGGKYADKINKHLTDLQAKVTDGKITEEEAGQITSYAQNLAAALGVTL